MGRDGEVRRLRVRVSERCEGMLVGGKRASVYEEVNRRVCESLRKNKYLEKRLLKRL